uniref:Uncharacterized protein n=1 Tax=Knipowitschia caucasica TaxID=637954 RepID=A0AAV2KSE3_KNICA
MGLCFGCVWGLVRGGVSLSLAVGGCLGGGWLSVGWWVRCGVVICCVVCGFVVSCVLGCFVVRLLLVLGVVWRGWRIEPWVDFGCVFVGWFCWWVIVDVVVFWVVGGCGCSCRVFCLVVGWCWLVSWVEVWVWFYVVGVGSVVVGCVNRCLGGVLCCGLCWLVWLSCVGVRVMFRVCRVVLSVWCVRVNGCGVSGGVLVVLGFWGGVFVLVVWGVGWCRFVVVWWLVRCRFECCCCSGGGWVLLFNGFGLVCGVVHGRWFCSMLGVVCVSLGLLLVVVVGVLLWGFWCGFGFSWIVEVVVCCGVGKGVSGWLVCLVGCVVVEVLCVCVFGGFSIVVGGVVYFVSCVVWFGVVFCFGGCMCSALCVRVVVEEWVGWWWAVIGVGVGGVCFIVLGCGGGICFGGLVVGVECGNLSGLCWGRGICWLVWLVCVLGLFGFSVLVSGVWWVLLFSLLGLLWGGGW